MILPSKHLSQDHALLTRGARVLQHMSQPMTISALWEVLLQNVPGRDNEPPFRYDGFVLALDLLFLIEAIEIHDGLLTRKTP